MVRLLLLRNVLVSSTAALAMSSISSCRATSPTASAIKSGQERADEPVAAPGNQANIGVLRWVIATRSDAVGGDAASRWNVVLKTDSEVWCEARCSKFELVEILDGDTNELRVKKTTIAGNTTPGMLDVQKEFFGKNEPARKLRLLNVGVRGETVVLDDVVTKDRPNFYAVPMKITSGTGGEKSALTGELSGKMVELRLEKGAALPKVVSLATGHAEVFVMGSLLETKNPGGESLRQFYAFKVLPSTED